MGRIEQVPKNSPIATGSPIGPIILTTSARPRPAEAPEELLCAVSGEDDPDNHTHEKQGDVHRRAIFRHCSFARRLDPATRHSPLSVDVKVRPFVVAR